MNQVDSDFLVIKEKINKEHASFIKKFQNNNNYQKFTKTTKRNYTLYFVLFLLYALCVGVGTFFLIKYFSDFTVYIIISCAALVVIPLLLILISLTNRIKISNKTNKTGLYNFYNTIEESYNKISFFMNTIDVETASDLEKSEFYLSLSKVFKSVAIKMSELYKNKKEKIEKLSQEKQAKWSEILVYAYNFGKYCFNKEKDTKTFSELLKI